MDDQDIPEPVLSAPPEEELERQLKKDPDNLDLQIDVGSDQSMDASDPPSTSQPGEADEPVPSSSYPENPKL